MMGHSTLMHCSGWMELARVEAASSAARTTWKEKKKENIDRFMLRTHSWTMKAGMGTG